MKFHFKRTPIQRALMVNSKKQRVPKVLALLKHFNKIQRRDSADYAQKKEFEL